jgi:hypothetical protein
MEGNIENRRTRFIRNVVEFQLSTSHPAPQQTVILNKWFVCDKYNNDGGRRHEDCYRRFLRNGGTQS